MNLVTLSAMSVAELKKKVRTLSSAELNELVSYIHCLAPKMDDAWKAEMFRRKDEMAAGKKFSREQVLKMVGIHESDLK